MRCVGDGAKVFRGLFQALPSAVTVGGMAVSFYLLSFAGKTLTLGTAYAIGAGSGALGAVMVGIFLFHEPVSLTRLGFLCLMRVGILGLKLTCA